MLAVSINAGRVELVEVPRPELQDPADAIVMVTTAAIGHWEIGQARDEGSARSPGAQFAGVVVETGETVSQVSIDDLVVATCAGIAPDGRRVRFGTANLPGGHAEYVRVPNADETLVRTTAAAEERTVFAGGEAALGVRASDRALEVAGDGLIVVSGCDAASLAAIASIRQHRGRAGEVQVTKASGACLAAAKSLGAKELAFENLDMDETAALITSMDAAVWISRAPAFPINPANSGESGEMPSLEETRRTEMAIRLQQLDLTPLVSTVLPLDDAAEAYRLAVEQPPGVRSVLLKP